MCKLLGLMPYPYGRQLWSREQVLLADAGQRRDSGDI